MDVIDIAADVIRERDQLKQRVRELEQALSIPPPAIAEAAERIAKAKAILSHSMSESREFLLIQIGKALNALEGKSGEHNALDEPREKR